MTDDRALVLHAMQQAGPGTLVDLFALAAALGWRERRMRTVAKKLADAGFIEITKVRMHARLTKAGASI